MYESTSVAINDTGSVPSGTLQQAGIVNQTNQPRFILWSSYSERDSISSECLWQWQGLQKKRGFPDVPCDMVMRLPTY